MKFHLDQEDLAIGNLIEHVEKLLIGDVIEAARYNQSVAAKALGITRLTLRNKLSKYYGRRFFPRIRD